MASATIDAASEVDLGDEAIPTDRINIIERESLPPEFVNLSFRDCTPDPYDSKNKERRKKNMAIMKKAHNVHPDEPNRDSSEDQGADPFGNPDIIQDLTDKFAMPEESGHHMLAHVKRANLLEAEVLKVREDLQSKINRLQTMAVEAERLIGKKIAESESLHGALRKKEFISIELKAALWLSHITLALEGKEKKEAKLKIAELEAQLAFIKGFKLYEGRMARRFSELNLSFLKEEKEVGKEA
ncbi:hypothetical protein COCNU_10G007690 [Cocos nucifera]|uniref:Uncharacterized protein n=1 Tax=Cocos nucifera TaxID=13894 RepID=A0A8K0IM42_COCNU|nr:hypothetical protein COCNU_10G007690 [Cocos nucifera]